MLAPTQVLAERLRSCLQESEELPKDFQKLFNDTLFKVGSEPPHRFTDSLPRTAAGGRAIYSLNRALAHARLKTPMLTLPVSSACSHMLAQGRGIPAQTRALARTRTCTFHRFAMTTVASPDSF